MEEKKAKVSSYQLIVVIFTLIVVGMGWLGWHVYSTHQVTARIIDRDSKMIRLRGEIIRLDEILTLLSRVAVKTGDLKYVDRYDELFKKLDDAIVAVLKLAPPRIEKAVVEKTDSANKKLLAMEKKALDLVRAGRNEEAEKIVFGAEYDKQKKIYSDGMDVLNNYLEEISRQTIAERDRAQILLFIVAGVMAFLAMGLGTIFRFQVKTHNSLQESYLKLDQLFQKLQTAQTQLVQSEKMAALGQLVAGVAHEVNTPLGAIRASVSNIANSLRSVMDKWPKVIQVLPEATRSLFFSLVERSLEKKEYATSKDERKFKRRLTSTLEDANIKNSDDLADTLVDMGIYENIEEYFPLLKDEHSEMVLDMGYNLASQDKNSRNIMIAVERAGKVVFALKSYTHQDKSGKMVYADLVRGIDTVLTIYESKFKSGVELITHYDEIPRVLCFADELNQVWTNLIHNGLQAMDFKGKLEVNVKKDGDNVKIYIIDSGTGIPDNIKDEVFEPFFTTKAQGEGSGLGLDIVRKIIERHDGTITFESEPGRTAFCVTLPAEKREVLKGREKGV